MKLDNNKAEFERWLRQANFDLKAAEDSMNKDNFEWCCFQAQQGGEKALKAYLFLKGKRSVLTHSVFQLIKLCQKINDKFKEINDAKELDQYYIPTRYPNGLPADIPHSFYTKEDASKCVGYAKRILSFVEMVVKQK